MHHNKIKSTAKLTAIYSVSNIIVKMSGLILLPLYTSHISVEQYGLLALYEIIFEVLNLISGLGVDTALTRWYWDKESGYDKKVVVFNASLVSVITTFATMILGYFSVMGFSGELFGSKQSLAIISWFMISNLSRILIRQPLVLMRTQEQALKQTIVNIIRIAIVVAGSYLAIAHYKFGLMGIFMAETLANVIILPYLISHIIKNISFKLELGLIKDMLKFSLPLVTSWILTLVLTLSDRYVIKFFGNLGDVGIYNLAYKISNVVRVFVVHSFAQAYIPIFYKTMHDNDRSNFYIKAFNYYTFVAVIIALGLTVFGQEAIQIVAKSKDYWGAYTILPYLVIGTIFAGFRQILVLPLNKHKRTKVISIANFSAGIMNICLNILLVPYIGTIGAALATALSNLMVVLIYYYYMLKLENIRYEEWKIANALVACILISTVAMFVSDFSLLNRLLIKSGLFISFPIIMYITGFYSKQEIHDVRHALLQLKKANKFNLLKK
jgi:O-antigen/teichoic acid export membrane protein